MTAKVLGETEDPRAVGALIASLTDKDPDVRSEALTALRRITSRDFGMDYVAWVTWHQTHLATESETETTEPGAGEAAPPPAGNDSSPAPVSSSAAPTERSGDLFRNRLADCSGPRESVRTWVDLGEAAVPALLICLDDPDPNVRKSAIQSLALTGRKDASEAVCRRLLEDNDACVRAKAAGALGLLEGDCAQEALLQGLQDPSEQVRFYAVTALRWVGDSRAVWPLILRLDDRDARVRSRAYMILKHLTGQELPQEPVLWQDWYGRRASRETDEKTSPEEKSRTGEEG